MVFLRCQFVYGNAIRLQTQCIPHHIFTSAPRCTPHKGKMARSVLKEPCVMKWLRMVCLQDVAHTEDSVACCTTLQARGMAPGRVALHTRRGHDHAPPCNTPRSTLTVMKREEMPEGDALVVHVLHQLAFVQERQEAIPSVHVGRQPWHDLHRNNSVTEDASIACCEASFGNECPQMDALRRQAAQAVAINYLLHAATPHSTSLAAQRISYQLLISTIHFIVHQDGACCRFRRACQATQDGMRPSDNSVNKATGNFHITDAVPYDCLLQNAPYCSTEAVFAGRCSASALSEPSISFRPTDSGCNAYRS